MDQPIINPVIPESPQKSFPKWPFIALFVFIFGIASVFAYQKYLPKKTLPVVSSPSPVTVLPSPSVDPTANWKTYVNTKTGYLLKYSPNSGLQLIDCSDSEYQSNQNIFILADAKNSGCQGQGEGWMVYTMEGDESCESTESWQATKQSITINGIVATKCSLKFIGQNLYGGPTERIRTIFSNGSKSVSLILKDLSYSDLYGQILSTFKFID